MKNREIATPQVVNKLSAEKYKVQCYFEGKIVRTLYHIIKVENDKKYGYFVFHQKIYHHEIIFVTRYKEIDKIEIIDKDNNRKEMTCDD